VVEGARADARLGRTAARPARRVARGRALAASSTRLDAPFAAAAVRARVAARDDAVARRADPPSGRRRRGLPGPGPRGVRRRRRALRPRPEPDPDLRRQLRVGRQGRDAGRRRASAGAVDREYPHTWHRQFLLDGSTPPAVEAALVLRGYEHSASLLLLLEGAVQGAVRAHDVRPIASDADWAAYARLKQRDSDARAARLGIRDASELGADMFREHRAKVPPAQYWLAWLDGTPRGFLASWPGTEGVGQVEDLYVEPEVRQRGLATALLHRGVADCRTRGADPVAIVADATDTPKHMYGAMGFRPVAVVHKYLLRPDAAS